MLRIVALEKKRSGTMKDEFPLAARDGAKRLATCTRRSWSAPPTVLCFLADHGTPSVDSGSRQQRCTAIRNWHGQGWRPRPMGARSRREGG